MNKAVGYAIAGAILLLVADAAPKIAVWTSGLILFGVVLRQSGQIDKLAGLLPAAQGTESTAGQGKA